jgi:7-keto-8-aminopelargonate synthetase-like enzyme
VGDYLRRFHFSFFLFGYLSMSMFTNAVLPLGTTVLHNQLEKYVAKFVGKPSAIVFGMGFATNNAVLPALIGKVCAVNQ